MYGTVFLTFFNYFTLRNLRFINQTLKKMLKQILEKLERIESMLKQEEVQMMSFEDAQKYLNYSKAYLYKLTFSRKIPYYKPNGKMIYFNKAELDKWLMKNRVLTNEDIEALADRFMKKNKMGL